MKAIIRRTLLEEYYYKINQRKMGKKHEQKNRKKRQKI